jgi:seryl-tRNA(Sec) selenium transferase
MITTSLPCLMERGNRILEKLPVVQQYDSDSNSDSYTDRLRVEIIDDDAQVGGGAFPMQTIPSLSLAFSFEPEQTGTERQRHIGTKKAANRQENFVPLSHGQINQVEEQFRLGRPPVLGRINQGRFLLNLRTIQEEDLPDIVQAMRHVLEYWGSKKA